MIHNERSQVPVLQYATEEAENHFEIVPKAEALILAGHSHNSLRPLFKRTAHAVRYFCKSLASRCSYSNLPVKCVCGADATNAIRLAWLARAAFRQREIVRDAVDEEGQFDTFHALCPACLEDWKNRILRYRLLRNLLHTSVLVLRVGWVPVLLFYYFAHIHFSPLVIIGFCGLLQVLWFVGQINSRYIERQYPPLVRTILRKNVYLLGISCIFIYHDGKLSAMS